MSICIFVLCNVGYWNSILCKKIDISFVFDYVWVIMVFVLEIIYMCDVGLSLFEWSISFK